MDIKIVPEQVSLFRAIPNLKESLSVNIELASPADFLPELPGWQDRSPFIARFGDVDFHHYDFVGQALAKVERGHAQDLEDVRAMVARGMLSASDLREAYAKIESKLLRYPSIDPGTFATKVDELAQELESESA